MNNKEKNACIKFHVVSKSDEFLRQAMWECYQHRCVYCGELIEPRQMQIDHIFPTDEKRIRNSNDSDLKAYIEELKQRGFEKNSIENYLVSCADCNNKKKNYEFNAANFRYYHELAGRHVPSILKRIEQIKRKFSSFPVETNSGLQEKRYNVDELICDAEVFESAYQCFFRYGLGNVRIDAFLPVSYEDEMSCIIYFKEIYQTDIFLTYNEESIKKYFFTGYGTPFDSEERYWCTCYENLMTEPVYEVNLPNMKLNVSRETLQQMAKICDRLYEEYTIRKANISDILGVNEFVKLDKKSYRLFAINEQILEILYEFMRMHQYDQSADDEYNIFHLTNSKESFYLHRNMNSTNYRADIYACIDIIKSSKHYGYYDVVWSPGYTASGYDKMNNFDNVIKWTADYTYDWFVNECIPSAIDRYFEQRMNMVQRMFRKDKDIYTAQRLLNEKLIISYKNETKII